jgi:hypothetical protein
MSFRRKKIGLKVHFKGYFKENDEKSRDFMNSLNDMFQLCFRHWKSLREIIGFHVFGREYLHCCGNSGGKMEYYGWIWV